MKSYLQNRIAPPTSVKRDDLPDKKIDQVKDKDAQPKVDFGSVLYNSSVETKREREAKKVGDLSSASKEEFLQKLAEQTNGNKKLPNNKLGKEDFLRLFIEQLKNQDPLNPDSGAELAAKLAQFNSVEQMTNVNKSLEKLAEAQSLDRSMMMSNFIGKEMTVNGGRVRIEGDKISGANYRLPRGAAKATIDIRDEGGSLVRTLDIGSVPGGEHKLNWDGKDKEGKGLRPGLYTFHVNATDVDNEEVPVELTSKVKITGVDVAGKQGTLYTDFGTVAIDQVKALGEPGFFKKEKMKEGAKETNPADKTKVINGNPAQQLRQGAQAKVQPQPAPTQPSTATQKQAQTQQPPALAPQAKKLEASAPKEKEAYAGEPQTKVPVPGNLPERPASPTLPAS